MHTNGKHGVKAKDYTAFEKQRKPYFGYLDVICMDPDGSWRPKGIWDYFQLQGIMLDNVPAEAHWNLSHVERCIGWVKEFLTKSSLEKDDREPDQLGTCPIEGRVVLGRQHLKTMGNYAPVTFSARGELPINQ